MSNIKTVERFFTAVTKNNKEDIMSFFDEDSVFNNIPMGPVKGRRAIWEILKITAEASSEVLFEVINIAETDDGVVLTERVDYFNMNHGKVAFSLMGAFEIENGIIRQWRDYFDLKQSMDQMPSDTDLSFLD